MLTALLVTAVLQADAFAVVAPGFSPAIRAQLKLRATNAQAAPEVIVEIRVHGNLLITDDELRRLIGVEPGTVMTPGTIDEVTNRLKASRRFEEVEIRKRFASISDPSRVVLIVIVDEGPVTIESSGRDGPARVTKRGGAGLMMVPLLSYEDGYGLAYGAQFARPGIAGTRSRLSIPISWGGDKRAAASLEKYFDKGPLTRVDVGASVGRRTNPYYDEDDDRQRVWARGERRLTKAIAAGVTGAWQHVSFLSDRDHVTDVGADLTIDTRLNPVLPRNAVYARAGFTRTSVQHEGALHRVELEGQGYVGLVGQTVLVVRALKTDADRALPPYLQPMLGGIGSVRGFKAGSAIGDTHVAGSVEVLVPLTSPFQVAKLGVSAFFDAGAVYKDGERLADQTIARGAGGSVWVSASIVRFNLAVAHGIGGTTRVHVGAVFGF